jgi:acyl dehydratase
VTKLALSNISDFVGRELGVSGWMTVDQSRINQFAKCTGDHQSIHVLADRQAVSRSADQHFCYHI